MPDTLIDPRLEADLAELLAPEPRQPLPVRIAAFIAVPAAIALLAGLAAIPLLTPATEQVVVIHSAAPQTAPTPTPTPTPTATATPQPTPTTDPPPIAAVEAEPAWVAAAEGMAAAFAVDYLSWSQLPEDQRGTALADYLAPGVDPTVGWQTPGPLVAATPIVMDTAVHDEDAVTVTVAVRVTGEQTARWIRVAIPIARDADDQPAVTDLPHIVTNPPAGSPPPPFDTPDDSELRETVEATVLAAVTEHLAYLDRDTGFTADTLTVERAHRLDADTAVAVVGMRVSDQVTGSVLAQRLTVELHRTGAVWEVAQIR